MISLLIVGRFKTAAIMAAMVMQTIPALAVPYKSSQWISMTTEDGEFTFFGDYNRIKRKGDLYSIPISRLDNKTYQTMAVWFWYDCKARTGMMADEYGQGTPWAIVPAGSVSEFFLDLVCKTTTAPSSY